MMLKLICAMHCEASAIIEHFHLKKDSLITQFEVFRGDYLELIISGIGAIKASAATSFLLAKTTSPEESFIANIGVAGAASDLPIGELYLANRVLHQTNKRAFCPDILFSHKLPEVSLCTSDVPVHKDDIDKNACFDLYDMEASGICGAASLFLGPERILILKIVSDHLDVSGLSKSRIEELIEGRLFQIEETLRSFFNIENTKPFSNAEICAIEEISNRLFLTFSNRYRLQNACIKAKSSGLSLEEALKEWSNTDCSSKKASNDCFHSIMRKLHAC